MALENIQGVKRTYDDIGSYIAQDDRTVSEILDFKGDRVHTVSPSSSVYDALVIMSRHNIGALVVVVDEKVEGVISERDYARKVILIGKNSHETSVREIMSSPACTVEPHVTIADCLAVMTDSHVRHLPVVEDGELIGVLSIGDLVKAVIDDQEVRIQQYERYVQGTYPG